VARPQGGIEDDRNHDATVTSRRGLFRAAGALAVVGLGGGLTEAVEATSAQAAAGTGPLVATDPDLHLLRRATYGPTPQSVAAIKRVGRAAWLNQQLHPASIDDSACQHLVNTRLPQVNWTIGQTRRHYRDFSLEPMLRCTDAAIARAIWSKRQLFELMVDFWSNHLNVTSPAQIVWKTRHDYDRQVIRKHALGKFEDMLWASANHPAMMRYLNNDLSDWMNPNENYGRELLELHTVGVDGGYNETDMHQSALVMTGFGVDPKTDTFKYTAADHYTGSVSVMGFSDAQGAAVNGHAVGKRYLSYLANHPSTATHIATKLCIRFISDDPSPTLVQQLANIYTANGTDVVPVLQALFTSPEFDASVGKKIRRPYEDLVASVRVLGYKPDRRGMTGVRDLYWGLNRMGHRPYAWPQPNGYPDVALAWQSTAGTIARWNANRQLATHWWPLPLRRPNPRSWLPKRLPRTHGAVIDALSKRLVFRTMLPAHRAAILEYLGKRANEPVTRTSPVVTSRLPEVVALILDSPYHGIR